MVLVVIGWLYVALMMGVAEATHANGTVLGGIITFVLYGLLPAALVAYLLATPARRRALRHSAAPAGPATASNEPDESAVPPAAAQTDAVAPVREKR